MALAEDIDKITGSVVKLEGAVGRLDARFDQAPQPRSAGLPGGQGGGRVDFPAVGARSAGAPGGGQASSRLVAAEIGRAVAEALRSGGGAGGSGQGNGRTAGPSSDLLMRAIGGL